MTEPTVTDVEPSGEGYAVTVSDGVHSYRVWVPLSEKGMRDAAIQRWRALVEKQEKSAAICRAAAKQGGGP